MKKGWEMKKLGDEFQTATGNTPPKGNAKYYGDFMPLVKPPELTDSFIESSEDGLSKLGSTVARTLLPNSILVSCIGNLGKIALNTVEVAFNQQINAILPDPRKAVPEFMFYQVLSDGFRDQLKALASGTTVPIVNKSKFNSVGIVLPPLPEQQRIVGVLDEAFAGLATAQANAETNLQNARALFESHLQSVFSQRGEGWVEKRLGEVLDAQPQNGWSPPAANHSDSGTPVLTLSSVTGFIFKPEKIKFTSAVTSPTRSYWVKNGDFLITRSNTPELVGHVAIASGIEKPTIYPDLIMRMTPAPDRMITKFLYYQMRTPALRKEITGRAQGANPTMKKISNGAVKALPIVVAPLAAQRAIISTLDALAAETRRLETLYTQKLAALAALKKSLLHQAFSGAL